MWKFRGWRKYDIWEVLSAVWLGIWRGFLVVEIKNFYKLGFLCLGVEFFFSGFFMICIFVGRGF